MQSKIFLTVFATLLCGVSSQIVVPVPCADIDTVADFNLTAYFGKWYEIEASNHIEELGAICIEANYADFGNGSVEVVNTEILEINNQRYTIRGNAKPLDPLSTDAKFLVSFPSVNAYDAPYWVLDTDYDNYTIIWSCRPYGGNNSFQTLWFLSKKQNPSINVRTYVRNKLADLGLTTHLTLKETVQEGCPETQL